MLAWRDVYRLFRRAGVGGMLLSLGARETRLDDLEEQQLVNVVAEMAIAAGVQPPRVMVIDAEVVNAASVGSGLTDATVLVSRRLLDEMDRDETQGVLGHLIGSIGNGDLRVMPMLMAVFQTFGLLTTLLAAPVSRDARQALRQLLRLRWGRGAAMHEADAVGLLLTRRLQGLGLEEISGSMSRIEALAGRGFRRYPVYMLLFLVMPFLLAGIFGMFLVSVTFLFLLGPLLARTWRTRRYLADATAVQLTRNPDGLAAGLMTLAEKGALIPGGQWAAQLFVIGPEAAKARAGVRLQREMAALHEVNPDLSDLTKLRENWGTISETFGRYMAEVNEAEQGTFAAEQGLVIDFHPPLDRRLKRLQALGASVGLGDMHAVTWTHRKG